MDNELLEHALKYANRDLKVFPVAARSKKPPKTPSGCKDATTDANQIRVWWQKWPNANIGIATGAVMVVDLDVGDGKDGTQRWAELTRDKPDEAVPRTTGVRTPSGGVHLYYETPDGVTVKNSVSGLGEGIDVRGHGGYVVAPPSRRNDGAYEFIEADVGIAQAPFWLASKVLKNGSEVRSDTGSSGSQEGLDVPETIHEGARNDTLFRAACQLREKPGMAEEELRPTLHKMNTARCSPSLSDEEVNKIVDSVVKRYERGDYISDTRGDGQASGIPVPPNPAEQGEGDQHPDEWYEPAPNGRFEEGEEEGFDLENFRIESVPDLLSKDIRPPEPLITYDGRSLLHEGTSQLAAKPKIGKTNLAMNLGLAVSSGNGVALGNATVQRHGRVLMLNLDGSRRGSYDRFQTMTANDPGNGPERFDILHDEFPKVGDGALDLLDQYCNEHPDTELIIVDTLQHLRPTTDGRRNVYHEDYEFVHPIAELGRETDTSILLVHHLNKLKNGDELDKVSGSTGLTGAVENVMILDRARGESKAQLSVRPREDREEDFQLEFDGKVQTWIVGGQPTPSTPEREEVWNVLRSADGPMRLKDIASAVGKKSNTVSKLLDGLKTTDDMPVEKVGRGKYEAV